MTGHGRATAEREGRRATVEIRSVNHRFLDLKVRGAPIAPPIEEQLGARVREAVERGAVTVAIHLERRGDAAALRLDHAAARAAHAALAALAADLGLAPPDLALVLAQPGVIAASDELADDGPAGEAVLDAAGQALVRLIAMRAAEGEALAADLGARLDTLIDLLARIEAAASAQPEEVRRRLNDRLTRLLDDARVTLDPARLAQEVAVLADRADVTEEVVRARSHVAQVRGLIAAPTPGSSGRDAAVASRPGAGSAAAGREPREAIRSIGRRLDFLVQELGREINTIGSKSSAAEISRLVVEGKAELEKIREQAQNIE
jgi:uncharacterized protein (TIGR00255 family)